MNNDNEAILTISKKGCLVINDQVFEPHQLREAKLYLQQQGITKSFFWPKTQDDIEALNNIILEMGLLSPESTDHTILTNYLN
jgi:hypothetical protein